MSAAVKKHEATKTYKDIRKDLLDQLERNGTVGEHFVSLVEDYLSLWVTKMKLFEDIKELGVRVGAKKNESIDGAIKVNAQMLRILDQLNIKPSQVAGDDPEM